MTFETSTLIAIIYLLSMILIAYITEIKNGVNIFKDIFAEKEEPVVMRIFAAILLILISPAVGIYMGVHFLWRAR